MRLFAPLYLSNECVNNCSYCGFSRDNPILRTTLTLDQIATEARHLHSLGFRNLLLVAGEHPAQHDKIGAGAELLDAVEQVVRVGGGAPHRREPAKREIKIPQPPELFPQTPMKQMEWRKPKRG